MMIKKFFRSLKLLPVNIIKVSITTINGTRKYKRMFIFGIKMAEWEL